jgi:hypothetical protein
LPEPVAEVQAFVLVGLKGVEIGKYDTLPEALQGASDGDIIEICGHGPFITPPVDLGNRALTLRAAPGFHPIIQLDREGTSSGAPLLRTKGSLVLEGLELALTPEVIITDHPFRVVAGGPSVYAANCRFHWPSRGNFNTASPTCRFRNCQFVTGSAGGIMWSCSAEGGDLAIDNCVQADGGLIGVACWPSLKTAPNIRIARSTVRAGTVVTLHVEPEKVPVKAEPGALVRLEMSESVIDVNHPLRLQSTRAERAQLGPFAEKIDSVLPRLLTWRDRQNLYAEDRFAGFVGLNADGLIRPPLLRTLAIWEKATGQSKTDSSMGRVRYEGGDPLGGQMTPKDFRLRPDSTGYRAGKDKKDLGADLDLVGPGPAYDRWKKTPEYQEWLKETGQRK